MATPGREWRSALRLHAIICESVPWLQGLLRVPLLSLEDDVIREILGGLEMCQLLALAASCRSLRVHVRRAMLDRAPCFFVARTIGHPLGARLLHRTRTPNADYGVSDESLLRPHHAVRLGEATLVAHAFTSRYGGRQMLRLLPDDGEPTDFDDNFKELSPPRRLKADLAPATALAVGSRHVYVLEKTLAPPHEAVMMRSPATGECLDHLSASDLTAFAAFEDLLFILTAPASGPLCAVVQVWDMSQKHLRRLRHTFFAVPPGREIHAANLAVLRHDGLILCALLIRNARDPLSLTNQPAVRIFDVSALLAAPRPEGHPADLTPDASERLVVREFLTNSSGDSAEAAASYRYPHGLCADGAAGVLYVSEGVRRLGLGFGNKRLCIKAFSLGGRLLARYALSEPSALSDPTAPLSMGARSRVLVAQPTADCVLELGLRMAKG